MNKKTYYSDIKFQLVIRSQGIRIRILQGEDEVYSKSYVNRGLAYQDEDNAIRNQYDNMFRGINRILEEHSISHWDEGKINKSHNGEIFSEVIDMRLVDLFPKELFNLIPTQLDTLPHTLDYHLNKLSSLS
jgi:hypothetical protein